MVRKKYQVFISSTYVDLQEERIAVTQTLLDNDCIPVGMEQFPSSGMSQMEYIKKMLDDCDYYILILGGRYGSLDLDGIGFTEKEFDYAEAKEIPIMSFLIKDIDMLPRGKCDTDSEMQTKYEMFRKKVLSKRMVGFFKDVSSLQAIVATSINRCKFDFPAKGWVRGTGIENPSKAKVAERSQEKRQGNNFLYKQNLVGANADKEMMERVVKLEEEIKKRPPIHIGKSAPTDVNALWIPTD